MNALELMAADSDAIVRGVIEDWCFVAATEAPTGPSCGAEIRVNYKRSRKSWRRRRRTRDLAW